MPHRSKLSRYFGLGSTAGKEAREWRSSRGHCGVRVTLGAYQSYRRTDPFKGVYSDGSGMRWW